MPLEELGFVKTLAAFGVITQQTHFRNMAKIVWLRWLTFDNFK